MPVQKIRPFLWYNDSAVPAAEFYVSLFKDAKILKTMPGPGGKPMGVEFQLEDQWGVSWQIIPDALPRLMNDKDPAKAGRVVQAMLTMQKIVVADLERAYNG